MKAKKNGRDLPVADYYQLDNPSIKAARSLAFVQKQIFY
jgi:hypothetical protein